MRYTMVRRRCIADNCGKLYLRDFFPVRCGGSGLIAFHATHCLIESITRNYFGSPPPFGFLSLDHILQTKAVGVTLSIALIASTLPECFLKQNLSGMCWLLIFQYLLNHPQH